MTPAHSTNLWRSSPPILLKRWPFFTHFCKHGCSLASTASVGRFRPLAPFYALPMVHSSPSYPQPPCLNIFHCQQWNFHICSCCWTCCVFHTLLFYITKVTAAFFCHLFCHRFFLTPLAPSSKRCTRCGTPSRIFHTPLLFSVHPAPLPSLSIHLHALMSIPFCSLPPLVPLTMDHTPTFIVWPLASPLFFVQTHELPLPWSSSGLKGCVVKWAAWYFSQ